MMSSDEMTERVINKLNEHRKKVSRHNEIVRKITFGIVDKEKNKKGMGYMNTKSGILALTASMALIITATVSVFSLNMGKHIIPERTEMTDIPTTDESTEEITDVSTTEEFTEETSVPTEDEVVQQFRELELHEDFKRVYTFDEINAIVDNAQLEYKTNGAWLIDREKYMSYFSDSEMINSLELKSYIYHMMLNSVDYFNTAKGTMVYSVNHFDTEKGARICENINIEFQTNIAEEYAYEEQNNGYSHYFYDEMCYDVYSDDFTYRVLVGGHASGFSMSNNDRLVTVSDDGYDCAVNRPDMTNLAIAGNSCLLPQSIAMSRLSMFDAWDIVSTENILGFDCAVIEGTHADNNFRMYVDIAHGILMKYTENDEIIETTSLELDVEVEKKVFDATGYTEK
ncbi:MAG: hypothetical protein K2K91_01775 [Ruminococcus sp.]|nr:hypothetical protein [Ruminococcus sp.]